MPSSTRSAGRCGSACGPILLGIIVSTVLWTPVAWLRRHSWPAALAASPCCHGLAVAGGVLYLITRPIVAQSLDLANSAAEGIHRLQGWLTGPLIDLSGERLNTLTAAAADRLRSSAADIASGVFREVSVVSDTVVTAALVLVLAFFLHQRRPAFLPWLRRWTGPSIGAAYRSAPPSLADSEQLHPSAGSPQLDRRRAYQSRSRAAGCHPDPLIFAEIEDLRRGPLTGH
jgi:predicted PurR-regulated permease PerM